MFRSSDPRLLLISRLKVRFLPRSPNSLINMRLQTISTLGAVLLESSGARLVLGRKPVHSDAMSTPVQPAVAPRWDEDAKKLSRSARKQVSALKLWPRESADVLPTSMRSRPGAFR